MDGEQILIWASLINMAGMAFVAVLQWMNRSGRTDGARDADMESLHKAIHKLNDLVGALPTRESLKVLDAQMRMEIRETESRLLKHAADLASSLAQTTSALATALAQTTAAAAAALREPGK